MSLEVFPQSVTLYPGDLQTFEARGTHPPALWEVQDKGVVQPDYSVRQGVAASPDVSAQSALALRGGVGAIEWVTDISSLPLTGGVNFAQWSVFLSGASGPSSWQYIVRIFSNKVEIRDAGGLLQTLTRNTTVGMRFRVEIANSFRIFIDDVLQHSLTSFPSAVTYPASYAVIMQTTPSVQPTIFPAPRLSGDWRLRSVDLLGNLIVVFASPLGGSIVQSGLQAVYTAGATPGRYILAAQIDVGIDTWIEDAAPGGSSVSTTGGAWAWGSGSPLPFTGTARLKSPLAVGAAQYKIESITGTLQINKDDVLAFWVFLDATNPPTEIMIQFKATDATGFEHRAYWGADSIALGTNGTPSRWFMGALPATNQWIKLEVPASVVALEGSVLHGVSFDIFGAGGGGQCSFDHMGKYPGRLQYAESVINIPPLQILGELTQTVQPSAKFRLQTNYDVAQTPNLAAWSVPSGKGAFSGNEFTASATPGTSTLRATSGSQIADLIVKVSEIITPSFRFAGPGEQIDFDTNISIMPAFVAAGSVAEGTGSIAPGLPAGIQPNDVLWLVCESANESVSTPTDWAIVADSPQGTGTGGATTATRLSLFWRRVPLNGVISAPTVGDPGDHIVGQIFAYRNCVETGNPWDVTAGNTGASASAVSIPGDTTTQPNTLIFQAVSFATDTATPQVSGFANSDLANLTERANVASTQGNGGGFAVVEGQKATAGAFSATTATLANASVQARITVALRPALVTWTASGGSINAGSGLWQAPLGIDQTVKITVTDGVFTATRDMLILPLFPLDNPKLPMQWRRARTSLISMSEDRTSRIVRDKAAPYDSYEVRFEAVTLAQSNQIDAFWDERGYGKPFILEDKERDIRLAGWFDSEIQHEGAEQCAQDLSFRFIEAPLEAIG